MALKGSEVRDTARVLGIGINTVIRELKKANIQTVNTKLLNCKKETQKSIKVDIIRVEEVEMD